MVHDDSFEARRPSRACGPHDDHTPTLTKEGSYETSLGFPRVAPVGAAHRLRRLSDTGTHGCGWASQGWWLFGVLGGTILNAELVRQGYAQVATFPPIVKYQKLFLRFQREAREAKRGLWGE
jgi:hypothetical protein